MLVSSASARCRRIQFRTGMSPWIARGSIRQLVHMLRDPNTLSFLRLEDSVGRAAAASARQLSDDFRWSDARFPRAAKLYSTARLCCTGCGLDPPVDVNYNRSLISVFAAVRRRSPVVSSCVRRSGALPRIRESRPPVPDG